MSGADTAVVEVIDNSTSTLLMKCTVNSTNKNNCSTTTETGTAAAGNLLEAKITANGASASGKAWVVTFRY